MIITFVVQFTLTLGKSSSDVRKLDEGTSLPPNATARHKATNACASVPSHVESSSD